MRQINYGSEVSAPRLRLRHVLIPSCTPQPAPHTSVLLCPGRARWASLTFPVCPVVSVLSSGAWGVVRLASWWHYERIEPSRICKSQKGTDYWDAVDLLSSSHFHDTESWQPVCSCPCFSCSLLSLPSLHPCVFFPVNCCCAHLHIAFFAHVTYWLL